MADAPTSIDLTGRACAAAVRAIKNEKPNLAREPRQIKSIVIELAVDSRGQVFEADCYTQRRVTVNEALGFTRGRPQRLT